MIQDPTLIHRYLFSLGILLVIFYIYILYKNDDIKSAFVTIYLYTAVLIFEIILLFVACFTYFINDLVNLLNNWKFQILLNYLNNMSINNYNQSFNLGDYITLIAFLFAGLSLFIYFFAYIAVKASPFFEIEIDKEGGSKLFLIFTYISIIIYTIGFLIIIFYLQKVIFGGPFYEISLMGFFLILWTPILYSYSLIRKKIKEYQNLDEINTLFEKIGYLNIGQKILDRYYTTFIFLSNIVLIYVAFILNINATTFLFLEIILIQIHWVTSSIANIPRIKYNICLMIDDLFTRISLNSVYILFELQNGDLKVLTSSNQIIHLNKAHIVSISPIF